jgi:hypothetical protein
VATLVASLAGNFSLASVSNDPTPPLAIVGHAQLAGEHAQQRILHAGGEASSGFEHSRQWRAEHKQGIAAIHGDILCWK